MPLPADDKLGRQEGADVKTAVPVTSSHVSPAAPLFPPQPATAAPLPERIGRYRVIEKLGQGGQASVYRAIDDQLGRDVAIKWSNRALVGDAQREKNFLAEGAVLANLERTPNLARVYDCGLHEDRPFVVIEYLRGDNLERYARKQRLAPARAAAVVAAVARALEVVHRHHVVHQDIKPHNILMDEQGQPHLLDFGLAQQQDYWVSAPDQPQGSTPAYASPEQARGEAVGAASDVFSLGGVLYFLLTGAAPFSGGNAVACLERAARCDFDRAALESPTVSPRLRAICLKALGPTPAERYPSARELADDLDGFLRPRRRWPIAMALLVVLVGGALSWWALQPAVKTPPVRQHLVRMLQRTESGGERVFTPRSPEELQKLAPLRKGDRVHGSVEVPAGYHVAAFCWTSRRGLESLPTAPSSTAEGLVRHRFPAATSWEVPGPRETLLIVVLADARPTPAAKEVQALLADDGEPWPILAPFVCLLAHRDDVDVVGETPRDDLVILERLESLRARLRERVAYFWVMAVPQK